MKQSLVFFGTGPVSLRCLEGIHRHFKLEAVITKPDRRSPSGKQHQHPVKSWAELHGVPVYQVDTEQELKLLWGSQQFASRAGLVVDFGLTIPQSIITSFELGIINSHFSLLPRLRGPDPISFAILEGLAETGVSIMRIVPRLDEGDLLSQEAYPLTSSITTPVLTEALSDLSNQMLIRDLPRYMEEELAPYPQNPAIPPTYSLKLTKADGIIDWHKSAVQLERQVRAFIGWPGSRTQLFDRDVTITATHVLVGKMGSGKNLRPGTILPHPHEPLAVMTGGGALAIDSLKPAGKQEMSAADFIRGYTKR